MSGVEDVETSTESPENASRETDMTSPESKSEESTTNDFDAQQDLYRGAEDLVSRIVAEAPYEARERSSEERESEDDESDYPPSSSYPLLQSWDRHVLYVLYWRDMKLSGQLFFTGVILLLAMTRYSLLYVFSLATLSILIVAFVWRAGIMVLQVLKKESTSNPMQQYLDVAIEIPEEKVIRLTKTLTLKVECLIKYYRRLVLIDDVVKSLKFAIEMWLLSWVACCFSGLTLLFTGFLLAFSVPALYERNKVQVDHQLEKLKQKSDSIFDKLQKRFPILGKLKQQ